MSLCCFRVDRHGVRRVRCAVPGSIESVRGLPAVASIRLRRSSARVSHLFAGRIKKGNAGRLP